MRLPDGPRQIVAALAASAAFLALYFGVHLIWWAAFAVAVIVYAALLLIVRRKPPDDEVMLSSRVSAADIRQASAALAASARRLTAAADTGPPEDRPLIEDMVAHIGSIRSQIEAEPEDFRRARRFLVSYLPNIVETVESYAALAARASGDQAERLAPIRARIRDFGPALARIDAACLENDFAALEVQVDALATQLKRG